MIVYPTIEILHGKCVSLERGNIDQPLIWPVDPIQIACSFAAAGAEWMQVTDFNAIDGDKSNSALIEEIIRAAGIPVQVAGGIRTIEAAEQWMDRGAGRVVFGTSAVTNARMVKQFADSHPDQAVVAMDVLHGRVLTDGWRSEGPFGPVAFLESYASTPLAAFLITDVAAVIAEIEVGASEMAIFARATRTPIIASGLVRALDDISTLKYAGHCAGVIVGRALFDRTVDLREALAVAAPQIEQMATFL
jgi:phosphoribosylformimino-5-aminoimidazole carboxamide ribotide isomerase